MIALKFSEFYKGNYKDQGYELYLVKDLNQKAMYIGISQDSVWHRWFGGGTSHMDVNIAGDLFGKSNIGQVIQRRLPESWEWKVELWTKQDCLDYFNEIFKNMKPEKLSINAIEPYMIQKFEPLYNVAHSGGRHEDPMVSKKLDEAYKKFFG